MKLPMENRKGVMCDEKIRHAVQELILSLADPDVGDYWDTVETEEGLFDVNIYGETYGALMGYLHIVVYPIDSNQTTLYENVIGRARVLVKHCVNAAFKSPTRKHKSSYWDVLDSHNEEICAKAYPYMQRRIYLRRKTMVNIVRIVNELDKEDCVTLCITESLATATRIYEEAVEKLDRCEENIVKEEFNKLVGNVIRDVGGLSHKNFGEYIADGIYV